LIYLVNIRPDIYFVVNTLSQFMVKLREVHWVVAKHMLRYLQGTVGYGLQYLGDDGVRLQGYSQAMIYIGRAPMGVASVWGQQSFPGSTGSKPQ
jgi:hypothetical protein